ncbi:MAG: FtsX-like permease family protein [Rikenellaceae bacterium]
MITCFLSYIRTHDNVTKEQVTDEIKRCLLDCYPECNTELLIVKDFEEEQAEQLVETKNLFRLITTFTIVSILIALMGIFGLVIFETAHRAQEITIRRIHGASIAGILWMINRKFIKISIVSFMMAAPLSYYIIQRWLESYEYRTPIHWWVFALILIVVVLLIVAVVTIRSYRTASANPTIQIRKNN